MEQPQKQISTNTNAEIVSVDSFNTNTFDVKSTYYPDDLFDEKDNRYDNSYCVFYISVHENSYLLKEKGVPSINGTINARNAGFLDGKKYSGADVAGGVAGTALLAPAAAAAKSIFDGGRGKAFLTVAGGLGVAAAAEATGFVDAAIDGIKNLSVNENISSFFDKTKELIGELSNDKKTIRQAIALHVPVELRRNYSVPYESTDVAGFTAGIEIAKSGIDALTADDPSAGLLKAANAAGGYLAGVALSTGPYGRGVQKTSGITANPKREQLFQGVEFRQFDMPYTFWPKDKNEAERVASIIKLFKLHMHPEYLDDNEFLYIQPSEFDVVFYRNGKIDTNIPRMTTCVLTGVNVNYNPQQVVSRLPNGEFPMITMTLSFKELALLSKKDIDEGNY